MILITTVAAVKVPLQQRDIVIAFQRVGGSANRIHKRNYNVISHGNDNRVLTASPFISGNKPSLWKTIKKSRVFPFFLDASFSSSSSGEKDDSAGSSSSNNIGDEDIWILGGDNFYSDDLFPSSNSNTNNPNDNEDVKTPKDSDNTDDGDSLDKLLLQSLQARAAELQSQTNALHTRWINATCRSTVQLSLNDWIRRISLHKWPLAVVGTANGSIRLVNLETGDTVAMVDGAHSRLGGNPVALRYLHGEWDGGGPIAVAMTTTASGAGTTGGKNNGVVVVSAGREGAAKVWRLDTTPPPSSSSSSSSSTSKNSKEIDGSGTNYTAPNTSGSKKGATTPSAQLTSLGEISSLKGSMVTSLHIDDYSRLWVGCYDDSTLHGFDLSVPSSSSSSEASQPVSLKRTMRIQLDSDEHILCMAVSEDIGLIAVGTARGTVELISTEDNELLGTWNPYSGSTHVRSVAIVPTSSSKTGYCLVCGGGDGTMHILRNLAVDDVTGLATGLQGSDGDSSTPFSWSEEITPRHKNMVVSLTACGENLKGLFVSGAHDGTLRLWNCDGDEDVVSDKVEKEEDENDPSLLSPSPPQLLYQLVGYKVWLGNVQVDSEGIRLLSDGSDNSVVVHDFSLPTNSIDEDDP